MTNETQNHTLWLTAVNHPELKFQINEAGQCVGYMWDVADERPKRLSAEREAIQASEGALYFDTDGVLDLHKWLSILQERKARSLAADRMLDDTLDAVDADLPRPAHTLFKGVRVPTAQGYIYDIAEPTENPRDAFPPSLALMNWEGEGNGVRLVNGGPILTEKKVSPCPAVIADALAWDATRDRARKAAGVPAMEETVKAAYTLYHDAQIAVQRAPAHNLQDLFAKASIWLDDWKAAIDPLCGIAGASLVADLKALATQPQPMKGAA